MRNSKIKLSTLCLAMCSLVYGQIEAQTVVYDAQKEKQWYSIETGPWDFSARYYYLFTHQNYSGAKLSGLDVKFSEERSNVRTVIPRRITSEVTEEENLKKTDEEVSHIQELYIEDLANEADRNIDITYSYYKDDFNDLQASINEALTFCMNKSKGKVWKTVDRFIRQNDIICENIAYLHKTGYGYELENSKRQKGYEKAYEDMKKLAKQVTYYAKCVNVMY